MSHGITDEDRAAYAHQVAWHGLGDVMDHFLSAEEAKGVLGWEPVTVPLVGLAGQQDVSFDDYLGVIRNDTQAGLGVVGKGWTPITNSDVIEFIDDVVRESSLSGNRIESVASLFGGKRVFVTANLGGWSLDRKVSPKPDLYKSYLASITAHDGSLAWYAFFTDVRVVCNNTVQLSMSLASGDHNANMFRVKHTMKAKERIELAKRVSIEHVNYQTALRDEMNELEQSMMHLSQVRDWAATTLVGNDVDDGGLTLSQAVDQLAAGYNPKDNRERETPMDKLQTDVAQVAKLYSEGKGNLGATKYDAFNGLTEWLDHQRERYKRAKEAGEWRAKCLVDTMVGDTASTKRRALRLLKRW